MSVSTTTDLSAEALAELTDAVGAEHVLLAPDLDNYVDPYGFIDEVTTRPAAAVRPATVEQVQQVVRLAGRHRLALWPVSRGRNLGYGGASARVEGSVVLDLGRLDRILAVDEEAGYAIVEPGVSFLALAEYLRTEAPRLMASVPDIGWGSVVGNALERGFGYTAHGDHAANQCGMEVVLADGEVVRTGMGAQDDSSSWALYKGGYGPSLDGLFFQSNLGVVTKMGVWLQPRPETTTVCMISTARDADLEALVELIHPLQLDGTVQSNVIIGNAPIVACMATPRVSWWEGPGAMPDEVIDRISQTMHVGRWNARFALYGPPDLVEARVAVVRRRVEAALPHAELHVSTYAADVDPATVFPGDRVQLGIPSTDLVRMADWRGGSSPAHIDFSLVCPPTAGDVITQMRLIRSTVEAHGFDYAGGFTMFPRHAIALALISFDASNETERADVAALFPALIHAAAAAGYAPYRSHLAFMDLIADQYAWNDHALRRLTGRIKTALDPDGILAPGKQGIWPATTARPA